MEELILRKFLDSDIPLYKNWLYLPHVAAWYHDPQDWLYEVENRNTEYTWLHHFIAEVDGKPIGFCQYYAYCNSGETWHGNTEVRGTYSIDYMIGDASYLNRGFGKRIVIQLIQQIRTHENAERIIVQPEVENKASCNTLLSCGFVFDRENGIFIYDLKEKPVRGPGDGNVKDVAAR